MWTRHSNFCFTLLFGRIGALVNELTYTMKDIMLTCIILHNMIVKDERDTFSDKVDVDYEHLNNDISNVEVSRNTFPDFVTYLQIRLVINTRGIHQHFQANLMKYIWKHYHYTNNKI